MEMCDFSERTVGRAWREFGELLQPTDEMRVLASMCYAVTYLDAFGRRKAKLSFPWVFWDVLKYVKAEKRHLEDPNRPLILPRPPVAIVHPLSRRLYAKMREFDSVRNTLAFELFQ